MQQQGPQDAAKDIAERIAARIKSRRGEEETSAAEAQTERRAVDLGRELSAAFRSDDPRRIYDAVRALIRVELASSRR